MTEQNSSDSGPQEDQDTVINNKLENLPTAKRKKLEALAGLVVEILTADKDSKEQVKH